MHVVRYAAGSRASDLALHESTMYCFYGKEGKRTGLALLKLVSCRLNNVAMRNSFVSILINRRRLPDERILMHRSRRLLLFVIHNAQLCVILVSGSNCVGT